VSILDRLVVRRQHIPMVSFLLAKYPVRLFVLMNWLTTQRKSAGTLAPICVGVFFLILTGFYENHTNDPYAIFPHALMRNFRGFSIVMGVTFMIGMLYYSTLILWPLQIQTFYATNSTTIGLYSMAFSLSGATTALIFGPCFERVNQARWIFGRNMFPWNYFLWYSSYRRYVASLVTGTPSVLEKRWLFAEPKH
jgi:hypothetical protein